MVLSLLSPEIQYDENRSLLPEDKNKEASLYEITLYDKDEVIALGQPVKTFIERNIVFYPIYLVEDDKVSLQIGLYETLADNVENILDEDGDIDIELLGQPLLYGFVNKSLIYKEQLSKEQLSKEQLSKDKEQQISKEQLIPTEKKAQEPVKEQTKEEAESERTNYTKQKGDFWFKTFMENGNYRMIENEGKGDCLFAVIRDALAKVNVFKSVDEMRKILSDNVTEDIFQGYKTVYQDAATADEQLIKEIKVMAKRHKDLKKNLNDTKDRNAKQLIIKQAEEVSKRHIIAKRERAYTKSVIEGELRMMKNIHNLAQFKTLIQTCSFWGDTWAISTLERILNIKLILFSQENFREGDLDNVLTCGQLNDTVLEEKGVFTPDYYILTNYLGWHYQLISYKDKGALTFNEIPYDIKLKVVDKCLERLAGPYYIIPDFREFMEKLKNPVFVSKEPAALELTALEPAALEPVSIKETVSLGPTISSLEPSTDPDIELHSDLYNNGTIFQFYNKSVDKPPGKGTGETIDSIEEYKDLKQILDWRRKLDNLWVEPFTLDGHKWNSVEHYYQGSKYKRDHPDVYLQFSLDSGSSLSKDPTLAKEPQMVKEVKEVKEAKGRNRKVKIDEDFNKRSEREMETAQYAKFSQNKDLKTLLLETKKAKLQHFVRGAPPELVNTLMKVRQTIHS
jgi:predicted NAD-dependent protein-ADP-ribosyltransferase YbiA (DUF1768 family)